jgi:hypothetical protein
VQAPLLLRTAQLPRETLPSFLSRLAAVNGVGAADFAVDLGFSIKRFLNLEEDAVQALAGAGGLDAAEVAEILFWTGSGVGDVRMEFRSEVFVSRALRNPRMRGCPVCLREDARGQERTPARAMALRGDWQLREVSLCVRHGHPLVTLWEVGTPTHRYDVAARLNKVAEGVLAGEFDAEPVTPSPYDLWLDARLEDGRDATWLARQSLFAATTFCRLLGAELLRLEERPDGDPAAWLRAAQAAGFAVARHGPEAIEAALDRLVGLANRPSDGPNKAFGRLFQKLQQDYRDEPAFAPFRKLLRDRILEVWPIAPGTDLLGEVVTERRLHSVHTAAQEAGIGTAPMEQLLIAAGAIAANDPRPAARKTFAAAPHAELLAEIPTLIGSRRCARPWGLTRTRSRPWSPTAFWHRAPRACRRLGGCGTASIWWPRCRRGRHASRRGRRGGRACRGPAPARDWGWTRSSAPSVTGACRLGNRPVTTAGAASGCGRPRSIGWHGREVPRPSAG